MTGRLTIGADPEFFVRRGAHYVSGHEFNCGSKLSPMPTMNGSVQVDGVALECNVHPATTEDEFVLNCKGVMEDLNAIVKTVDPRCELLTRPSIFLGRSFLSSLPTEVQELACRPDWNAYTGHTNPSPDRASPIRTGAGHIHLGWTENENERSVTHFSFCQEVTSELDYAVGLFSLEFDTDSRRRSLYGKAGAFRPKPYGCEYRTLSNRWLSDERFMREVFRRSSRAYENVRSGDTLYDGYGLLAQHIIDEGCTGWKTEFKDLAEVVEDRYART